jgi:hypothetical protein
VFYNAINGDYILQIEGYCSVDPGDANRMTVTCKTGNEYKRNALGKSDNVLWFYEQLTTSNVSANHYKVIFKPDGDRPRARDPLSRPAHDEGVVALPGLAGAASGDVLPARDPCRRTSDVERNLTGRARSKSRPVFSGRTPRWPCGLASTAAPSASVMS